MKDIDKNHLKVQENQHVFIYCTCGRSSSTAFQRILNSSNNIWVWGEQHGLIDKINSLSEEVARLKNEPDVRLSLSRLDTCIKQNKHSLFYPNAIGNLESYNRLLTSSLSLLLKPASNTVQRFGFKEISIAEIRTLRGLKSIYPNCHILFCFRNPIEQWPSVSKLQWWDYSKSLKLYLKEYQRISDIYLEYNKENLSTVFVENIDLRLKQKIKQILSYINVSGIDEELIDVTVHTAAATEASPEELSIILESKAHKNYLKMKKLSQSFYEKHLD